MVYHILNGEALSEKFPSSQIPGHIVVMREAFIEGPLSLELNEDYWQKRLEFLHHAYAADKNDYEEQFFSQLSMLDQIKDDDEVCLWFEDDLFCIVNMWFAVDYISRKAKPSFNRIFPVADNTNWVGFAYDNEFTMYYNHRVKFDESDVQLTNQLWESYVHNDQAKLKALSFSHSQVYRYLPEVVQAHLDRFTRDGSAGRPQQTLIALINEGMTDFYDIFEAFWKKESIYGFGDMQVYNMLREMEIDISEL